MKKLKIKKGDTVKIIAGEHKGSEGKIITVLISKNKVIVEGVNLVKKHEKPSSKNPKGGMKEFEAPIHISNLSLLTSDGKTTRVGFKTENNKKIRFSKKTKEII
jgi:large subunit ribosomal protein L24